MSRSNDAAVISHWHTPDTPVPTIAHGEGPRFTTNDGKEYLDFVSQMACVNAGNSNTAIIEAMQDQLEVIPFVGSKSHNDVRSRLADRIGEIAPGALSDVFFAVSGSEANEVAAQFAREYNNAPKVLTRWRSYHGWTYGAGGMSGDPQTRRFESHAATTGSVKFLPPMAYRSPFDADTPEELADQAADHLEFVVRNEEPASIAAILMEPVAGSSGAYPTPPGYLQRVREICDEYDILMIADEVITGFGRCGEWFGVDTESVEPDMLTFAKGVTSSYAPLAGVVMNPSVGDQLRSDGVSVGQTFAGHPVACAGGLAAIDEYESGLIDNVRQLSPVLEERLRGLAEQHDVVGHVRGRGFLWAVEITDPATGEPFFDPRVDAGPNPVTRVQRATFEKGVLVGTGRPGFQLTLYPPFVIDEDDIDTAVSALSSAITTVFE